MNTLADDEQYLKDLTAKCELKAREWDQRSNMRKNELAALATALGIMTDRAKSASEEGAVYEDLITKTSKVSPHSYVPPSSSDNDDVDSSDDDADDDVNFLQLEHHPR